MSADSVVSTLGNVTPARERALEQMARHGRCRVGQGMYDDRLAAVSPAGVTWLLRNRLVETVDDPPTHLVRMTQRGWNAAAELGITE